MCACVRVRVSDRNTRGGDVVPVARKGESVHKRKKERSHNSEDEGDIIVKEGWTGVLARRSRRSLTLNKSAAW